MEAISDIVAQLGAPSVLLTALVPVILQMLKRIPAIEKLQKDGYKVYELLPIIIAVFGAFVLKLPIPIVTGIISGLASEKGYDFVKGKGTKK